MIRGINHLTFATADLDRALAFYAGTLGLEVSHRWDRGAYLRAGTLWLCLERADAVSAPDDDGHTAFDVAHGDLAILEARLREAGARRWKENTSEGPSLYVLDPDGRKLEFHVGSLDSRLSSIAARPDPEEARP